MKKKPESGTISVDRKWYDMIEQIASEDRRTMKATLEIILEIFFEDDTPTKTKGTEISYGK